MEKKHIIRFLKERKRGSYTLLVKMYADAVTSMSVTMAMELIREDLERESGTSVELNYFSLAKAFSRFKRKEGKRTGAGTDRNWDFKDANETKEGQLSPGKFKVGLTKDKDVQ
jgi:hypothetical protein